MEQRLIDANKLEEEFGCSDRDIYAKEYIREAPTVFEFPENPTNGDMIKAIFPNVKTRDNSDDFITYTFDGIVGTMVEKAWWNAPYKKESD